MKWGKVEGNVILAHYKFNFIRVHDNWYKIQVMISSVLKFTFEEYILFVGVQVNL